MLRYQYHNWLVTIIHAIKQRLYSRTHLYPSFARFLKKSFFVDIRAPPLSKSILFLKYSTFCYLSQSLNLNSCIQFSWDIKYNILIPLQFPHSSLLPHIHGPYVCPITLAPCHTTYIVFKIMSITSPHNSPYLQLLYTRSIFTLYPIPNFSNFPLISVFFQPPPLFPKHVTALLPLLHHL